MRALFWRLSGKCDDYVTGAVDAILEAGPPADPAPYLVDDAGRVSVRMTRPERGAIATAYRLAGQTGCLEWFRC